MRALRLVIPGLAVLLLGATSGWAQPGGGGGRMGGPRGDPSAMFDQMANGKDVVRRSEITNQWMLAMFDRMAERMGITSGEITRQQYLAYMQQRLAQRFGGGGPPAASPTPGTPPGPPAGPGAPAGPPGTGGGNGNNFDQWAGVAFGRMDQNGDGVLNFDEMPEDLRSERDKWDTDHNGLIDLNEFKAYFAARMQQRMTEWASSGGNSWGGQGGVAIVTPPPEEEDPKPVVYRAGKLPPGLPAWFQQLDTDHDGQIGLYEWKDSGRPLEEFDQMDRNKDGFLTIQEVMASAGLNKQTTTQVASASGGTPSGPTTEVVFSSPGGDAAQGGRPMRGGGRGGAPGMGGGGPPPGPGGGAPFGRGGGRGRNRPGPPG